ncbi:No66 [Symbiodinium natans]|uniref:No66 protein n=1 Tax=Symbiodinium natans TaxID=878477 RepID=A0A812QIM8_9DINO|nr:No66 [Symbiodinium natans]
MSHLATSAVVRILIEERLGYKVVEQGPGPGTLNAFYALLGCTSPLNLTDRGCGAPVTYSHINMETWAEGYANEWNEIQARFTSIAPINAGSMGYVGKASAFIPQRVREQAYFQDGTVLDFFRGWNVSWSSPWMFFDSLDSIERSHLLPCNQTRFMISKANEDYLRHLLHFLMFEVVGRTHIFPRHFL